MPIKLSIIDDSNSLIQIAPQILSSTQQCESFLPTFFPDISLDINLQVKVGKMVIPEIGIGGYAPTQNEIYITIDPLNNFLANHFNTAYQATLYHESHHCFRHATVGYGETLFQAMVSEGLACHFEEETGHSKPIYVNHLSNNQRQLLIKKMQKLWHQQPYDHASWFFGNAKLDIPRWSAYDIGYYLIDIYINSSNQTASSCHDTCYSDIQKLLQDIRVIDV